MTFGPPNLCPSPIRQIIKRKENVGLIKRHNEGGILWKDISLTPLKGKIRSQLRSQQEGRCVYCRRVILLERRNAYEDIEHFLDKSKPRYLKWSFCCVNLTLACHACNFEKSTKDLGSLALGADLRYPRGLGIYRWLHPYFDNYFENIDIGRGWTYIVAQNAPFPVQAQAMIDECKLGDIEAIEAHAELIKMTIERLTKLSGRALRKGQVNRALKMIEACERYQAEHWSAF